MSDEDLIHEIRKACYIHFGKNNILMIEELLRRYKNALAKSASV